MLRKENAIPLVLGGLALATAYLASKKRSTASSAAPSVPPAASKPPPGTGTSAPSTPWETPSRDQSAARVPGVWEPIRSPFVNMPDVEAIVRAGIRAGDGRPAPSPLQPPGQRPGNCPLGQVQVPWNSPYWVKDRDTMVVDAATGKTYGCVRTEHLPPNERYDHWYK